MEILDIVDEQGIPTGETVERSVAHSTGVRHRTSHVWLFRRREGRVEVLLQKEAKIKIHTLAVMISPAPDISLQGWILFLRLYENWKKSWVKGFKGRIYILRAATFSV